MIRNIFWFIFFVIYTVFSLIPMAFYLLLGLLGLKKLQKKFLLQVVTIWGKSMIGASGTTVEVTGLENLPKEDNVLFVSNHQGNADIPLLLGHIPKLKGIIAKIELKKMPILNFWMGFIGCIFMDRKNIRQSYQAIEKGIERLAKGHAMVIFPEGTRSKGSEMKKFKKGSLKLALKSNVLIVPLTINGSYRMFEANNNKISRTKIKLHIHPAINVDNLSEDEEKNLADMIQSIIEAKLTQFIADEKE